MQLTLAIAWTILCLGAFISVIIAVAAKMWPMAVIQILITGATGFMAYVRWTAK